MPRGAAKWGSASGRNAARACLVIAVLLIACGSPSDMSRCERASDVLLGAIETGLTVTAGGSLRSGFGVRSDDFERVWFVAAEIDGPGMEDAGDVGVWATNTAPDVQNAADIGLIFAVDGFAQEFSDWGADAPEQFSMEDDGAEEARACAAS
jgi:hypothetical protein